jgi:HD-GYP domain-containing protein (c-di-GMP phosphodiesterase class II)
MAMSEYLVLTLEQKRELTLASILHDIGKVGITDQILTNNGRLSVEELEIIREHPRVGAELVGNIK